MSAPLAASTGSRSTRPSPLPTASASPRILADGSYPSGQARRSVNPRRWADSTQEFATLFPSPTKATVIRRRSRPLSWAVIRSASTWQGWWSSVSPLITGTDDAAAISSATAWENVRMMIPSAYRDRTRAVSRTGSPGGDGQRREKPEDVPRGAVDDEPAREETVRDLLGLPLHLDRQHESPPPDLPDVLAAAGHLPEPLPAHGALSPDLVADTPG